MKNKETKKTEVIEGYNPKIYRNLTIVFVILAVINIAIVMFAFSIIGYGLWHSESALSYVASINSEVAEIHKNIYDISLHPDDTVEIEKNIGNINDSYSSLLASAEKFRAIDLSNIDDNLSSDFEDTISLVVSYYKAVSVELDAVKNGSRDVEVLYDAQKTSLQNKASMSITSLLKKQDTATYDFFCKVAQRFLIVIGVLLGTWGIGLFAIQRAKKRDKQNAIKLNESNSKTESMRRKAMDLAYINVTTGLQNRFALEQELAERVKGESLITAMYNFNYFKQINEKYGRDFADEFIAKIFNKVNDNVKDKAKVYQTDADEICVLFNKDTLRRHASETTNDILEILSNEVIVNEKQIQLTVSACVYYKSKENISASKLIMVLDKGITNAKALSHAKNKSVILPIN